MEMALFCDSHVTVKCGGVTLEWLGVGLGVGTVAPWNTVRVRACCCRIVIEPTSITFELA